MVTESLNLFGPKKTRVKVMQPFFGYAPGSNGDGAFVPREGRHTCGGQVRYVDGPLGLYSECKKCGAFSSEVLGRTVK